MQVVIPKLQQKVSKTTKTTGISSSQVRKVIIVEEEKICGASMILDEELPWGTTSNTLLSAVSFGMIKLDLHYRPLVIER